MLGPLERILVTAASVGIIALNADEIRVFFSDTTALTQQIATAGDMKSIGRALDYEYMKTGRYPREDAFGEWLRKNFQEETGRALMMDHWDRPYVYATSAGEKSFILQSAGPDGVRGSADDMEYSGP